MPKGIPRNQSTDREILHRLKIARGHLDKVIKMVEDKDYCLDIVHQSLAIQSALKKADNIILKNHLMHCVPNAVKEGQQEETVEEIMKVFDKK